MTLNNREEEIHSCNTLVKVRGHTSLIPPKPVLPVINSKSSVISTLRSIQKYILEFQYNYTGRVFVPLRKDKGMKHLIFSAKEIMRACLPIQCVESVFIAVYLTNGIDKLYRIPISFTTVAEDKEYHHLVLGVSSKNVWGAMGISRLKRLMYKRMQFDSLIDLVKEFEESYKFYCHDLLVVEIGLPFSHHDISETPLLWKAVRFSLQDGNCLEDYKVAFTRLSNDLETVAFYYQRTGNFPEWFDEDYRRGALGGK